MDTNTYTLSELAGLANLPSRTVRYYIQIGLIPRPLGVGRGAHYGRAHLERLLSIQKWQSAGLSLERIREVLDTPDDAPDLPPASNRPGTLVVRSHLHIAPGLELVIDPETARLSPEQVQRLVQQTLHTLKTIKKEQDPTE